MKGDTYLESGYVFAPYVPLSMTRRLSVWFEESPQPGDLIMFHLAAIQANGPRSYRQSSGLCTRAWTVEKCGECLYETGELVEFEKDPPFEGSSWLEIISRSSGV